MLKARSLLLGLTLGVFVFSVASAAPPPRWRRGGNPVCTATGPQSSPSAIRSGAGAVIIAWNDERRGAGLNDIYAQRMQVDGARSPGWPVNGALVASGAVLSHLQSDRADGAMFVWHAPGGQVRAQHLLADGTLDPLVPADGRLIASGIGGPSWSSFVASPDGVGGTYLLYVTFDGTVEHVMLTRVNASGVEVPGWSPPIEVAAWAFEFGGITGLSLTTLPSGRVVVGWGIRSEGFFGADYYGNVRAYLPDGTRAYHTDLNSALGLPAVFAPTVVAGSGDDILVQIPALGIANRLDASGLPLWPLSPAVIANGAVRADLTGGLYVTQIPLQSPIVKRLDPTGALASGWPAEGVALTSPFDLSSYDTEVIPEGIYFAWSRTPRARVRVTFVSAGGAVGAGWSLGGVLAGRAHGRQTQPTVSPRDAQSAFVAWKDERRGEADIFANLVVVDPLSLASDDDLPVDLDDAPRARVLITSVLASRATGGIRLTGTTAAPGLARLDLFDVSGRRVSGSDVELGGGAFEVRLTVPGLAKGIYWLRLSTAGGTTSRRVALVDE